MYVVTYKETNKGTFQARKNQEAVEDLKKQLFVAENLLSKREINCVDDLNIGDLSAIRIHGDLGAHGVPGWIPLGGLSLLEQALPGFLAINSKQNHININSNSFAMRFLALTGCTSLS